MKINHSYHQQFHRNYIIKFWKLNINLISKDNKYIEMLLNIKNMDILKWICLHFKPLNKQLLIWKIKWAEIHHIELQYLNWTKIIKSHFLFLSLCVFHKIKSNLKKIHKFKRQIRLRQLLILKKLSNLL